MESAAARAEPYRNKAEEVRAVAESVKDATTKQLLLGVAEDYLSMAAALDRIEGPNAPSRATRLSDRT